MNSAIADVSGLLGFQSASIEDNSFISRVSSCFEAESVAKESRENDLIPLVILPYLAEESQS